MTIKDLKKLVSQDEGISLEFKKSTGELKQALETICAFLNTKGGQVLFGVDPKSQIKGQSVSGNTIHEISQAFEKFDPAVYPNIERLKVGNGNEVIILLVDADKTGVPYVFDGRSYVRVGNTTKKMSRDHYEKLLFERMHSGMRWENQIAEDFTLKDLDRNEILRTREAAIRNMRIDPATPAKVTDILERLGLLVDGQLLRAAVVLYGKNLFPKMLQCHIKLGRFRGSSVTGEIIDNRQEHYNAFLTVREAMAFLERHLPLTGVFRSDSIYREDKLALPPEALREVLLNAVMHRDYAAVPGYVSVAIFDDRVEIYNNGTLPLGVTINQLTKKHKSKPRNHLIAGTFHRTGVVEIWGRGTNRVMDECKKYGVPPPNFEEESGGVTVTFFLPQKIRDAISGDKGSQQNDLTHQVTPQVSEQVNEQVNEQVSIMNLLVLLPKTKREMLLGAGLASVFMNYKRHIMPLVDVGMIEMTIPDKPNSRLQKYRLTVKGRSFLAEQKKKK